MKSMLGVPSWFESVEDVGVSTRLTWAEPGSAPKPMPIPSWLWLDKESELNRGYVINGPGPPLDEEVASLPELVASKEQSNVVLKQQVSWPQDNPALSRYYVPITAIDPPYVEYTDEGQVYHWTGIVNFLNGVADKHNKILPLDAEELTSYASVQQYLVPRSELWDEFATLAEQAGPFDTEQERDEEIARIQLRREQRMAKVYTNKAKLKMEMIMHEQRQDDDDDTPAPSDDASATSVTSRGSFTTVASQDFKDDGAKRAAKDAGRRLSVGLEEKRNQQPPKEPEQVVTPLPATNLWDAMDAPSNEPPVEPPEPSAPKYMVMAGRDGDYATWMTDDYERYLELYYAHDADRDTRDPRPPPEGYVTPTPPASSTPSAPQPPPADLPENDDNADLVITRRAFDRLDLRLTGNGRGVSPKYPGKTLRFENRGRNVYIWIM